VSMFADLKQRIQVREVTNTPGDGGGVDTTYAVKATVWGRVKNLPMSYSIGAYIRDAQVDKQPTHIITMRVNKDLGVTRPGLQGNMYLYVEDEPGSGRSFRIMSPMDKNDRGLTLDVLVREEGVQESEDGLT